MPTADIALFSRLVFLTFSKTTFSDDEKRRYNELKLIEKRGLTHLTGGLLKHRNQFRSNYRHMYDETAADFSVAFVGKIIEDRTFRNWVSITAAFRSIEHLLHLPFTYTEILPMVTRMCETQNLKTNENNELAGFWETVDILASSGKYGSAWTTTSKHPRKGNSNQRIKNATGAAGRGTLPIRIIPPYIAAIRQGKPRFREQKDTPRLAEILSGT